MTSQLNISHIDLNLLRLDKQNPRLPQSFPEEARSPQAIINWLLTDASIIELMLAIGQNGFFIGEALLVIESDGGGYTVVEGNRRLASLMLLDSPELATIHTQKIQAVLQETIQRPSEIPCIIFPSKDEIQRYLGYRHVTGVKSWGVEAKARYLHSLLPSLSSNTFSEQCSELAKNIGSRSDYVKKLLVSYKVYEVIKDQGFYNIPGLDDSSFYFNYIVESLKRENIREFIGIDLNTETPEINLDSDNLKELMDWFFRKNVNQRSRVLGNSSDVGMLDEVLSDSDSLQHFRETGNLAEAGKLSSQSPETFSQQLLEARQILKMSASYIHMISEHNESDTKFLKEISGLCRTMLGAIETKLEDWEV